MEELFYPSSENKGTDQLRGYREADLRLCFRLCKLLVFSWGGSYDNKNLLHALGNYSRKTNIPTQQIINDINLNKYE